MVRDPPPGVYRAKVLPRRIYTAAPRAALAWTVIRGASTPELRLRADRQSLARGRRELSLELTVDGYVAAGTRLRVECRALEGADCDDVGLESVRRTREDGVPDTASDWHLGTHRALGEVGVGETQENPARRRLRRRRGRAVVFRRDGLERQPPRRSRSRWGTRVRRRRRRDRRRTTHSPPRSPSAARRDRSRRTCSAPPRSPASRRCPGGRRASATPRRAIRRVPARGTPRRPADGPRRRRGTHGPPRPTASSGSVWAVRRTASPSMSTSTGAGPSRRSIRSSRSRRRAGASSRRRGPSTASASATGRDAPRVSGGRCP